MKMIMMRNARNDFDAFRIAQAMEDCGAHVFSISYDGQRPPEGMAMIPSSRFIVWAKVRDTEHIEQIDKAIDKALV